MPNLGPIKRKNLIRHLRKLGFSGPRQGGKHEYMIKGTLKLVIPNPHKGDIGQDLLTRILGQAGIDRDVWEQL